MGGGRTLRRVKLYFLLVLQLPLSSRFLLLLVNVAKFNLISLRATAHQIVVKLAKHIPASIVLRLRLKLADAFHDFDITLQELVLLLVIKKEPSQT